MLPAMVKGVESDFSSWWNGKEYEGEVAGRVYVEAIAAGVAANLKKITKNKYKMEAPKLLGEKVLQGEDTIDLYMANNTEANIYGTLANSLSYALTKKLLVGEKHKPNELINDFLRTCFKDQLEVTTLIKNFEAKSVKGSIFENSIYAFGSTMGLQIVEDFLGLLEDQEIKDAIADAKILSDISTEF